MRIDRIDIFRSSRDSQYTARDKYRSLFSSSEIKTELKQKTLRGGTAVICAEIITQILRIGSTMVLARLLLPEDFGILAMVTALTVFAERIKDLGLSDATIQAKEIDHDQVSFLFWINLGVCATITLFLSAFSKIIAWFYNEPRLVAVSLIIASTFLFSGLVIQHQAILNRTLRFQTISTIMLCSTSLSLVFAIILAFYSFGYWALVARELSRAIFVLFGTWFACPWRPSFPRRNTQIRHLLVFAKNVTGFNLVHFLSHSVDKILLGKLHGPYWVGVYINASQFLSLPINQLKAPLFTVGLPALSPLQSEPSSFHATFEKIAQLLTFFSMPIILFLALFGDVIVVLLLGTKWVKAVPIFRVLAVGAFLEPLVHMTGLAMVASGRTSQYFRMGTINASFLLSSLFIGSYWGVMGITAAYSFSTYLSLITCLVYGLKHTPIRVIPLLRRLAPNFFCSLATALLFLYARYAIGWEYASSWIALYAVAAVITYLGLCLIVPGGKEMMWSYWNYARTVMPKMRG